ncbi:receptor-like protein 7 [Ziziphus jujuba]|uniref:Receptor-like protein 7 n=1 Tax=Ziziphus jujuba TaxID=326968 RepID=A0ABM4A7N1_ZIZJJ|nr:receptor-like protein 7 [Ziziphus jujuba]
MSDCCTSWDGVKCDPNTGHVIELDVSSSYLHGSINSDSTLFSHVNLEKLNLAENDFSYSSIPKAFSKLSRLSYLNLSLCRFSDLIPNEILGLSRLTTLDLSVNIDVSSEQKLLQLKNPDLKSLILNLKRLEVLDLSFVDISSTVPDMLADLSTLRELSLRSCGLKGVFPTRIFQLPNLQFLSLSDNIDLYGSLPPLQRSSLKLFSNNNFNGTVNFDMFLGLKNLSQLDLSNNNLSGVTEPSEKFEVVESSRKPNWWSNTQMDMDRERGNFEGLESCEQLLDRL